MSFRKIISLSLMMLVMPMAANATCNVFGTTTICSDGNTVIRSGNVVFGSNGRTGSSWSQAKIGNTTIGLDSYGNAWSTVRTPNAVYGWKSNGNARSISGKKSASKIKQRHKQAHILLRGIHF